jgi:hypothetical protein
MSNARKKLEPALAKTDALPTEWFGRLEASIDGYAKTSLLMRSQLIRYSTYVSKKIKLY